MFKNFRIKTTAQMVMTAVVCMILLIFFADPSRSNTPPQQSPDWIQVNSRASLVHLGSIDSFDITEGGTQAAKLLVDAIENQKPEAARAALPIYKQLIPRENFGGDYTALHWFCEYLMASEIEQERFLSDNMTSEYFHFLADNDFAVLKEYLQRKYKLAEFADADSEAGRDREAFLEDFVRFSNPRRERWEKSSQIVGSMKLKPGQTVADIGSGPGYFTFKFAEQVGKTGQVFAIDTVQAHLNYLTQVSQKHGINNIEPIKTEGNSIGLQPNQVDVAYMCSLYHIIYTTSMEENKDQFVESIKTALKPDGRFVVVDNALVDNTELPYQGPYIAEELIISQLKYYGFELVDRQVPIPQRYVLTFKQT